MRIAAIVAGAVSIGACGSGPIEPPPGSDCAGISSGSLSLALGESCLLRAGDATAFVLSAAAGVRDYLIAVQSASEVPGATTSVRLTAMGPGGQGAGALQEPVPGAAILPSPAEVEASLSELRLRRNAIEELRRVGARPYRPARGASPPLAARAIRAVAAPGDTVILANSVESGLSVSCDSERTVTAVVQASGQRFSLLEDVDVAGSFSEADWMELSDELDELVFPVDSAYFGEPADIDGNGRVFVLFTADVNRLTPRGSSTIIAGFFNPSDLSDRESCPASNQAEILYLLAPDPAGRFSDPVSVAGAKANARGVTAHELQHLITAEQRVIIGGGSLFFDLEDTWLSEGLAHTAESVVGLHVAGFGTRADLTFDQLASSATTFSAYHRANFRRLGQYLFDPDGTLALGDANGFDPGGISSLEMRGFAWTFLRWLADHYAPATPPGIVPGSAESAFFRELSTGGPEHLSGIENLLRAVRVVSGQSKSWEDLLAEYAPAPALDGSGPGALDPRAQIPTWQLRDIFAGLNAAFPEKVPFTRVYPLAPSLIPLSELTNASVSFELAASAAHYFLLESGAPPPEILVEVRTPTGAPLPVSAKTQVLIVRTR